jgi:hypothetical protein
MIFSFQRDNSRLQPRRDVGPAKLARKTVDFSDAE